MAVTNLGKAQGNSSTTTLSAGVNNTDTSFPLTSDTNFDGEGYVIIDEGTASEEVCYATGKSGSALTIPLANRGLEGTAAAAHSAGATVKGIMTAGMWNNYITQFRAGLVDTNDNEVLKVGTTASAVNEITVTNAATGEFPTISATGEADTGIDFENSEGEEILKLDAIASAVNEVTVKNAVTTANPSLEASGGDDNIGIDIKPKGTGRVRTNKSVCIQVYDGADSLSMGDGKAYFTVPTELNGMNLIGVHAAVITAGTTNTTDIQIRNVTDSVDMLSTKMTIDTTETSTATAETAAVIDATKDDVATNDLIAVDIDAVSTTAPKGLIVRLEFGF